MNSTVDTSDNTDVGAENLLELLHKGDEIITSSNPEDVVLVMGNTGAGKSTLTQFIAGNNDDLISVEVNEGSGDFVIADKQGKISGNSTIISHTFVPELIVDPETNVAFYDCPGFSDTRSASHDIAASYFVKRIIDSSKRIKIVFVVNHSSVRYGVDRNDFILLLKHITKLVKNVDKFKGSTALVVTKVDNKYTKKGNTMVLVPDKKIIDSIANFLRSVIEDLKSTSSFQDNALKLVESFLEKTEDIYPKIGIFRRPDEPGPLSNISLLQSKREHLKNIINKNIHFVDISGNDFGYSVSSESINYIHKIAEDINLSISLELHLLGEYIVSQYVKMEARDNNIYPLFNEFKFGADIFSKLGERKNNSPLEVAEEILSHFKNMFRNVSEYSLHRIVDYDHYLNFLGDVGNATLAEPVKWFEGLKGTNGYMKDSLLWYDFIINLYDSLSEYSVQKNMGYFNIDNIVKKSVSETNGHIFVNSLGLEDLINKISKISQAHITERLFYRIKDVSINKSKLNFLKNLLDLTLDDEKKITCSYLNTFIVKGNYLKISEILTNSCYESVTNIVLMASTKIFIDDDIRKLGGKVQLSIFAPVWEVIGNKTISLDGKPGDFQGKADNGYYDGERGSDGTPGYPGGPGGNFIGVAGRITGGKLTISSNGGKGGRGEDGGDGAHGRSGADAPYVSEQETRTVFNEWGPENTWNSRGFSWSMLYSDNRGVVGWYYYKGYGKRASRAGDGGDGGAGGRGGCPGNVILKEISESPNVVITSRKGEDGNPGEGGSGGDVAQNGRNLYVDCRADRYVLVSATYCTNKRREFNGYGSSGIPGSRGVNRMGMQSVDSPKQITDVDALFNMYKDLLHPHLNSSFVSLVQLNSYINLENTHLSVSAAAQASVIIYECSHRNRRQATSFDEEAPPARNSATTATSPSILNILYSPMIILLKISNPINLINSVFPSINGIEQIKQYTKINQHDEMNKLNNNDFKEINYENNVYPYSSQFDHNYLSGLISTEKTDSTDHAIYNSNNSLFSSWSNLMLWDLIARAFSGKKHKYSFERYEREESCDFSHDLAYRYYLPH